MKSTEIIILRETLAQSVFSDAVTFLTICACAIPGWLLASEAFQWLAAFVAVLAILGRSDTRRLTIAEARARLDEIEAGQ